MTGSTSCPNEDAPLTITTSSNMASQVTVKSQRILACLLCQQRKVKCDRKSPCTNCTKIGVQCAPASLVPRQRRRRFPERELLERLRRYESLLRENNVAFEPLHKSHADVEKTSPSEDSRGSEVPDNGPLDKLREISDHSTSGKAPIKSDAEYTARDIWHALDQKKWFPAEEDDDDSDCSDDQVHINNPHQDHRRHTMVRKALDQWYESNDNFLFGSRKVSMELAGLHPGQIDIFKLWQVYLDNVNPLLKITHTPTLQTRIVNAAGNLSTISPALEALMFSIYCIAILSLADDECMSMFSSSKHDLMANYSFGCQQALLNSHFLRSDDRDCLTALNLWLIAIRPDTDARSISCMLGIAIRTAQHMGFHDGATYAQLNALESEMRRRLWWSLISFDNRIREISGLKDTTLAPTWNCRIPLNLNDSDFWSEMKTAPDPYGRPTEAIFAIVRSEICEFLRYSAFHLDFTNPILKAVAKDTKHLSERDGPADLAKTIDDKYLKFCNPEIPLHFLTIWWSHGYLAKIQLLEHISWYSKPSAQLQTDLQRDTAMSHALRILECDNKLMGSPLIKGYHWLVQADMPLLAYLNIVEDLRKRPVREHVIRVWQVMSDNYNIRFRQSNPDRPMFKNLARMILQAWEVRETVFKRSNRQLEPLPDLVVDLRHKAKNLLTKPSNAASKQPDDNATISQASSPSYINTWTTGSNLPQDVGYGSFMSGYVGHASYPDMSEIVGMDIDMTQLLEQLDWTAIDWDQMQI